MPFSNRSVSAVDAAYTCSSVNPSANKTFANTRESSCLLTFDSGSTEYLPPLPDQILHYLRCSNYYMHWALPLPTTIPPAVLLGCIGCTDDKFRASLHLLLLNLVYTFGIIMFMKTNSCWVRTC